MKQNESSQFFRNSNFLLKPKSAVTLIFLGWTITLFGKSTARSFQLLKSVFSAFLFFLYSNNNVHVTDDNVVGTARVRRTNPVLMDYQDFRLSAKNQQKLTDLTAEVHKIEDFLENEFNAFAEILDSKPKITAPDKK